MKTIRLQIKVCTCHRKEVEDTKGLYFCKVTGKYLQGFGILSRAEYEEIEVEVPEKVSVWERLFGK